MIGVPGISTGAEVGETTGVTGVLSRPRRSPPASGVGASIDLESDLRPEWLLFHEGPSRVLISTAAPEKVQAIAAKHGVEAPLVGATTPGRIEISARGKILVSDAVSRFQSGWDKALEDHVR